ncbi:MAG: site-specific DNA-methyltransferase [Acutalibacteraceae bacterium]|nr:site-specific DNA-methyltransferase [Acutalibacteraceae bacterium]
MINLDFSTWKREYSKNPHVVFNGDNIDVLKSLHAIYDKQVSCIYIDPPYNNGEKYTYYSDVQSHDNWLKQMEQVLRELKDFLKDDGSLWISIDDGEMHYLKVLCDTIFGRKSFVTTLIWQQRNTRENRKAFSNNHEYILVYSPNPELFKKKRNLLPITEDVLTRYHNPDNDPRGPWQSVSVNVQDGHAVESQFYEIIAPNGKIHTPPKGRCWIYNKEKMTEEIAQGNIWFGNDGNGVPRAKKFLKDRPRGVVPETLWLSSFVGTNKDAKTHLKALKIYDKDIFDTPKPETLIGQIIEIATNENELVMDAFLGSGTTVSAAHKLNRNYIGIESEYKTCDYVIKRMEQVVSGEKGGISKKVNWLGGGTCQFVF